MGYTGQMIHNQQCQSTEERPYKPKTCSYWQIYFKLIVKLFIRYSVN